MAGAAEVKTATNDSASAPTLLFMNIPTLMAKKIMIYRPLQCHRIKSGNGRSTKIVFLLLNLQFVCQHCESER